MTNVRQRVRPASSDTTVVRQRARPAREMICELVDDKDRESFLANTKNVEDALFAHPLPGIYHHCGECRKDHDTSGKLLGRVVRKGRPGPCHVFIYNGKGHPNDRKSYTMDVTKNYEDAVELLKKKHSCADEKPAARKRKVATPPTWATGVNLEKMTVRSRRKA